MKTYTAKLLLFGEYTIIKGTAALAFPLQAYSGSWKFDKTVDNDNLKKWSQYIDNQNFINNFSFDKNRFDQALHQGLYFDANIPIGYGVGSSGALCAALYDEFSVAETKLLSNEDAIFGLKSIFQTLENFFHGSSSGIDPLVCYLKKPLLLKGKETAQIVELPNKNTGKGAIFLVDTRQARQTEPLVNFFLNALNDKSYEQKIERELCSHNETAIHSFLNNDKTTLFENLTLISKFQYEYFQPMIPKEFKNLWKESLSSTTYELKLCGAGGGGFILGFSKNWEDTAKELTAYKTIKIQSI